MTLALDAVAALMRRGAGAKGQKEQCGGQCNGSVAHATSIAPHEPPSSFHGFGKNQFLRSWPMRTISFLIHFTSVPPTHGAIPAAGSATRKPLQYTRVLATQDGASHRRTIELRKWSRF